MKIIISLLLLGLLASSVVSKKKAMSEEIMIHKPDTKNEDVSMDKTKTKTKKTAEKKKIVIKENKETRDIFKR